MISNTSFQTSKRKIRVLHLITELKIGGAQSVLQMLLENQDHQAVQSTVACYFDADGGVARQIERLGIEVIDLKLTHKWRVDAIGRIYTLLQRLQPDVLHTWMFHANIPGRIIGRLARVPVIIGSEHTMGQEKGLRMQLNRLTSPLSDRVICVSPSVTEFARKQIGIASQRIVTINNGIDLRRFTDLPNQAKIRLKFGLDLSSFVIGAVGRPRPVKAYSVLLDAFQLLASNYPNSRLIFVGDGPGREALIEQARQLDMSEHVIFLHDRDDIPELLKTLDVLVSSSHWEGLSMVILEAMAAGLPIVATNVGGTPDLVVDGVTGLLTPPADPKAMAQAIERLIIDNSLGIALGQAGRQRVESYFTSVTMAEQTEKLYQMLLRAKGAFPKCDNL